MARKQSFDDGFRAKFEGTRLVGAVAAVVVVAVAVVGSSGGDGAACLSALADRVDGEDRFVQGSDMGRARAAGFDDGGSMEELGEEVLATGVAIDPGTSRVLRFMLEPRGAALGYEPGDVHCWLGGVERFVARGSFGDVQEGEADIGGSFAVDGSLLAHSPEGDPDNLLAGDEPTASLRGLVEAFDRHGAVSFVGITPSEDRRDMWAGVALAHGEGWELLAVWSYPDAGAAEAAESDIAEILRAESELGDMIEDDPTTVSRAVRSWRVWRRGLGWGGRG